MVELDRVLIKGITHIFTLSAMKYNILITSAGKRFALVRAFKETLVSFFPHGKVFTSDAKPLMAPAGYVSDKCFEVPRVTAPNYIDVLAQLCRDNSIGLIVPTIDTELMVLAQNKEMFKDIGVNISVGSQEFIATCRDKRLTGVLFNKLGVRTPRAIDKFNPSFPLFAKPYDGSLSKDLYVIRGASELTPEIINHPKLIFMEYIDKNEYKEFTVDMYYGKDYVLKMAVPRERIEIRAGETNKGRTVKGEIVDYVKSHFGTIDGCVGCICVQLFYNEANHDVVGIEINPRFGGGFPLSYAAGANYPEFLIREYFCDESIQYSDKWQDNLLMLRYDDAVFING